MSLHFLLVHTHTHMLSLQAPVHPSVGVSFFTCLRLINYSNYLVSIINFTVAVVCAVFLSLTVMSQTRTSLCSDSLFTHGFFARLSPRQLATWLQVTSSSGVYSPIPHMHTTPWEILDHSVVLARHFFFSVVASSPHSGQVPSLTAFQWFLVCTSESGEHRDFPPTPPPPTPLPGIY